MNESVLLVLGLVAAAFSTGSFLPQVLKSWKTRRTSDLSLLMILLLFVGAGLWFSYGIILKDLPIVIANGVMIVLLVSLVILKIKYG